MDRFEMMMQRYRDLKATKPDHLLLVRIGDFWETYENDAAIVAKALNITLTRRGTAPMCGFPYHSLDQRVQTLVDAGHKVALKHDGI